MDAENVKQVLEAFAQLGAEAKETFIWYLVLTKLPGFLIGLLWTGIGGFAVYHLLRIIRRAVKDAGYSERLRKAAGVYGDWRQEQIRVAQDILEKHYPEDKRM